jgi:hypothetical protein
MPKRLQKAAPDEPWLRRRLALVGAILAAQRIVKSGRKCGHFREQALRAPAEASRLRSHCSSQALSSLNHQGLPLRTRSQKP